MLFQFLYSLSGTNLIVLEVILAVFAIVYLVLIFKAKVRVGTFGNILSCLAGIVSPLTAALAVKIEFFEWLFAYRYILEMALIVLAAIGMLKGKSSALGIVIILGNYLFFSIAGTIIPLCMQNPRYWIESTLAVGAFGLFLLIANSRSIGGSSGLGTGSTIIPGSGDYDFNWNGNPYDNDGFTAYDRGTGRSFHYSGGEWYDQDGNMIPSASAHAWGLDDYYNRNIAGHDLTGHMPYDRK